MVDRDPSSQWVTIERQRVKVTRAGVIAFAALFCSLVTVSASSVLCSSVTVEELYQKEG